jgi:hypothetical protein
VGYAKVVTAPAAMPEDDLAVQLWKTDKGEGIAVRAELELISGNTQPKQLVKREWMKEDPILCELGIPYPVSLKQSEH